MYLFSTQWKFSSCFHWYTLSKMRRERLKFTTDCSICRAKRKKCYEKKSHCGSCEQIQSRCSYSVSNRISNSQRIGQAHDIRMSHCHTALSSARPRLSYTARVAEFNYAPSLSTLSNNTGEALETQGTRESPNRSDARFEPEVLEAFIISGVVDS